MMAMLAALVVVILGCVIYRQRRAHSAEVSAIAALSISDRDRKMAAFHVRRFSDAIEQCEKPEKLPELKSNLVYWRAVMAAEEARP